MIDHLMALDPGGRGIGAFFVRGGATAAASALRRSRRVLLTTGFAVGPGLPETDGPPGAACLGRDGLGREQPVAAADDPDPAHETHRRQRRCPVVQDRQAWRQAAQDIGLAPDVRLHETVGLRHHE